jgi:hypothetical protein
LDVFAGIESDRLPDQREIGRVNVERGAAVTLATLEHSETATMRRLERVRPMAARVATARLPAGLILNAD